VSEVECSECGAPVALGEASLSGGRLYCSACAQRTAIVVRPATETYPRWRPAGASEWPRSATLAVCLLASAAADTLLLAGARQFVHSYRGPVFGHGLVVGFLPPLVLVAGAAVAGSRRQAVGAVVLVAAFPAITLAWLSLTGGLSWALSGAMSSWFQNWTLFEMGVLAAAATAAALLSPRGATRNRRAWLQVGGPAAAGRLLVAVGALNTSGIPGPTSVNGDQSGTVALAVGIALSCILVAVTALALDRLLGSRLNSTGEAPTG
jgi:hypothetical protein